MGDSTKNTAAILLGFESASKADLDPDMNLAIGIAIKAGGIVDGGNKTHWTRTKKSGQRKGISGKWGNSFMSGGYLFTTANLSHLVLNTFETAITWDKFEEFHLEIITSIKNEINKQCGSGVITCRITHVYPDGPAPYYTIMAPGIL